MRALSPFQIYLISQFIKNFFSRYEIVLFCKRVLKDKRIINFDIFLQQKIILEFKHHYGKYHQVLKNCNKKIGNVNV